MNSNSASTASPLCTDRLGSGHAKKCSDRKRLSASQLPHMSLSIVAQVALMVDFREFESTLRLPSKACKGSSSYWRLRSPHLRALLASFRPVLYASRFNVGRSKIECATL